MKNVRILDCTLRDGGRIINCEFSDNEIKEMGRRLAEAKIDIIEVGFLRDWRNVSYAGNSTFFTDVHQIIPFIKKRNSMYVAFVDYGMFDFDTLKLYDGRSIDGIRVGFTKKNYNENLEDIVRCLKIVIERGYKLFIQSVNSLNYSDKELLELIDLVNDIHPYGFGIVDTYGAMYMDDVQRIYALVDNNLAKDICIDFHSHNNYQLSFALAQEVIRLSRGTRNIIIDATLNGMGKVAGNLNTELIVDYLVRKMNYDYESDQILDIIDDYIYKYKETEEWGYSIPALMAGIYQAHPNNICYLTQKFRLQARDIKNIVSMIDPMKRQRYDYGNIERIYVEYNSRKINDEECVKKLRKVIGQKEVLVITPGNSVKENRERILHYIEEKGPLVISVNYIFDKADMAFFGNSKRYANENEERAKKQCIISSNIVSDNKNDLRVNYYDLIDARYKYFENSLMMLLRLLRRIGITKLSLAGFDGFEKEKNNYVNESFQNERHTHEFSKLNNELAVMFEEFVKTINDKTKIKFLTSSIFEKCVKKDK